jgi:hypothetical protein
MGHSCDAYELFEVSGDELGAVPPLTDILVRATLRLPRVGMPTAEKAPKPFRAWAGRDIAPGRV